MPRPGARRGSSSSSTRSSTWPSSRRSTARRAPASTIDLIVRGACSIQPGPARRVGADPRPLDHRRVPRALADLELRQRRRARVLHRLGGPDGPQPRPAGRGGRAGRGPRRPGAAGRDHRRHARRRPPLVAAPAGRDLGPDRDARGPGGHHRHLRDAEGGRAGARQRRARRRAGRAPAPARWTRAHERRRRSARSRSSSSTGSSTSPPPSATSWPTRSARSAGPRRRARRSSRTATSTPPTARWPGPASRSGCGSPGAGTIVSVKSLGRTEGAGGAMRREELEGPADRTAGPLDWPASDARSLVLELAGDAPLRRARDHPPAPPQADRPRRRHAGRAEPRRGRRRLALARRRPVRRARGGAGQGRRGAAGRAGRGLRAPTRRWRRRRGSKLEAAMAAVGPARAPGGDADAARADGRAPSRRGRRPTTTRPPTSTPR